VSDYEYLNIPNACRVGNTIFKKLFYEKADLSTNDKNLFVDGIKKITWLYCLKPETINIQQYKDELRDYPELEVIEVELSWDSKLKRIAEIIMRTIPYPMLLIFKLEDKRRLCVAHQRNNQNDSARNTIEDFVSTEWLSDDNHLYEKLDIRQMRFTNFYALYSDIMDAISIYNVSEIIHTKRILSGEQARQYASNMEIIEQEITTLKTKLKTETQFNRKIEFNIEIKKLELEKKQLMEDE
jgi:hypothetical protein